MERSNSAPGPLERGETPQTFGPAARISGDAPAANFSKFFANNPATFRAVPSYSARLRHVELGSSRSLGTPGHDLGIASPNTASLEYSTFSRPPAWIASM